MTFGASRRSNTKYATHLADSIQYPHSTLFLYLYCLNASPAITVLIQEIQPLMLTSERQIQSLDDLRNYVNETLCDFGQLEPDAFRMTERILVRTGKPCGIYFCLHGPRSVKFSAIWETEQNRVLFYDSSGERCQKTQLVAASALELVAA